MKQETTEQEWQQLEDRINQFAGQFLKADSIEQKQDSFTLFTTQPEYKKDNAEDII